MHRPQTILVLCALGAASCAAPPPAQTPASPPPSRRNFVAAEVLFDEAVALSEARDYVEACDKFAESERLDHAINTLFNLGDCYERIGRLASAWEAFTQVVAEARQPGKDALQDEASRRAEALKPRLARLAIVVSPAIAEIPGVQVRRNGVVVEQELWNRSLPVDAGEQTILVSAPDRVSWQETMTVKAAESTKIAVPPLGGAAMPGQHLGALSAGGVGIAGILIGGIFGGLTFARWGDAVEACGGPDDQHTVCPTPEQAAAARALSDEAGTLATVSTVGFVVGGVGLVAAGILWFSAPVNTAPTSGTSWRLQIMNAGPGSLGGGVHGTF